jgi:hypothetical protein
VRNCFAGFANGMNNISFYRTHSPDFSYEKPFTADIPAVLAHMRMAGLLAR